MLYHDLHSEIGGRWARREEEEEYKGENQREVQ